MEYHIHAKGVSHMLQAGTLKGLVKVQAVQDFLSGVRGVRSRTTTAASSVTPGFTDPPSNVPPKPRSSSLRFFLRGTAPESEMAASFSLSCRSSRTSLAKIPRFLTVAVLSSSS